MIFSNEMPLVRKNKSLDDYNTSTWESVKAAGEQSLMETPTHSAWRTQELTRANIGKGEIQYKKYQYNIDQYVPVMQTEGKLQRGDAEKQIKDSRLPLTIPDDGYTQTALNIVMDRKRAELQRKAQIDATSGVIAGTAKFTAAIGAQILDPANVALAFVPVIGLAKYTAMIKAAASPMGRAKVRAGVGAVEGLVGAAIAEPIIYMAAQKEQADYTMSDSLLNVGMGTVFGAGLHAGAGAIGDAMKRGKSIDVATKTAEPIGETPKKVATAKPETREAMLKTSISQEARGIQTDVESIGASDTNLNKANVKTPLDDFDTGTVWYHGTQEKFDKFDIEKFGTNEPTGDYIGKAIFFAKDKETAAKYAIGGEVKEVNLRMKNPLIIKDGINSKFYDDVDLSILPKEHIEILGRDAPRAAYFKMTEEAKAEYTQAKGYDGLIDEDYGQAAVFTGDNVRPARKAPPITANPAKSLEATIQNETMRGDDPIASAKAQEKIDSKELDVDEELQLLSEQTANLETMTGNKAGNMVEYDNAITKAESDAVALEAAVTCRMMK